MFWHVSEECQDLHQTLAAPTIYKYNATQLLPYLKFKYSFTLLLLTGVPSKHQAF